MSQRCNQCNERNDDSAFACKKCGRPLYGDSTPAGSHDPASHRHDSTPELQRNSKPNQKPNVPRPNIPRPRPLGKKRPGTISTIVLALVLLSFTGTLNKIRHSFDDAQRTFERDYLPTTATPTTSINPEDPAPPSSRPGSFFESVDYADKQIDQVGVTVMRVADQTSISFTYLINPYARGDERYEARSFGIHSGMGGDYSPATMSASPGIPGSVKPTGKIVLENGTSVSWQVVPKGNGRDVVMTISRKGEKPLRIDGSRPTPVGRTYISPMTINETEEFFDELQERFVTPSG